MNSPDPFHVVVAGGGVAALEAVLALRDLAPERIRVTLLAPEDDFVYRPMTVREPFAFGPAQRFDVAEIAGDLGAELVRDGLGWVDAPGHVAHTTGGLALGYDALLIAVGSRVKPRYPRATTIDDRRMDELLHGLIQDIEEGYTTSVGFVAPSRMAWPLPLYELALMTATRARQMGVDPRIVIATPESTPLALFGITVGHAMTELLDQAGIEIITNAHVEVPDARELVIHPGDRQLQLGRIVALPELYGPGIRGLAAGEHGFIPVDEYAQVRGTQDVFAAGDATAFAVKHGGVASQQADTAALSIAALTDASLERKPFRPVIRGMLLTSDKPRYLTAHLVGDHGFSSQFTDEPTWSPPAKIAALHLGPYLEERVAIGAS